MAFREKMLWASLATTLAIWGWYFLGFVEALRSGRFDQGAETGSFALAVILIVVLHIAFAIVLAVASGREARAPADDREKSFALLGYRSAYLVLNLLVVTLMLAGPVLLRIANEWQPAPPPGMTPVLLGNALLLSIVLADAAQSVTQLVLYRKGG